MPTSRAIVTVTVATLVLMQRPSLTIAAGGVDVVTYHNDIARTAQNLNETFLTPASVNAAAFGRTGFLSVDGKVDAQPLYLSNVRIGGFARNVLFVATDHDTVYAFDADTGARLWGVSLLGSGETTSDTRSCGQVTPEIGVTSTPAIDRTRGPNGAMYVVAMSRNASGVYFQRLHALDVTSGAELFGGPRDIQASFPGTGAGGVVTFDPKQYKERAAVLLVNGQVVLDHGKLTPARPGRGLRGPGYLPPERRARR